MSRSRGRPRRRRLRAVGGAGGAPPAHARHRRRAAAGHRVAGGHRHAHRRGRAARRRHRRAQRHPRTGRRVRPVRHAAEPLRDRRCVDDVGGGRRLRAGRAARAARPARGRHAAVLSPRPLRGRRGLHQRRGRQGDAHGEGARRRAQPRPRAEGRDVRQGRHRHRRRARAHPAPERHPSRGRPDLRPRRAGQGRLRAEAGAARRRAQRLRRDPRGRDARGPRGHHREHPAQESHQVIARLVAFALHQRFVTLALALLLTAGGILSWTRLPIEAYPDVGDVTVEVITLWQGHAAEEVERLITIQLEKELNGIANVTFLRSASLFGLSNIRVLFADGTDKYWARQQVQERIAGAEVPTDARPTLGALSSVIGEVYRYTLWSPTMPLVELKALQDWVLEREFLKVAGVADVISWGGGVKQYQITIDPVRLRAYNLTLKQVFDAVIDGVKRKLEDIQQILPAGVELRPYYNRERLVKATVGTVMKNLIEGAALVVLLLSLFLYNVRAAILVALTIPLSLLFALIFMDLNAIPANLLSLGAIDFGIIVDGAVIMTENIVRH